MYTFDVSSGTRALNTQIQYYSGAIGGTPALALQNTYQDIYGNVLVPGSCCTTISDNFVHVKNRTAAVPVPGGSLVSQTAYTYDSFTSTTVNSGQSILQSRGKLLTQTEYGFGLGSPGPLVRQTLYSYLDDSNPNYHSVVNGSRYSIVNRPIDIQISDAAGNVKAETKTTYDSTALATVSGIQNHDDTNFGAGNTIRGNPTQVQKLVTGSTFITTSTASYDTTGQITSVQDGNGNVTSFSYADNFFNEGNSVQNPPPSFTPPNPTNAYLTQVTLPIIGAARYGYYYGTGKQASSVDQNGADSYSHYLDPNDRPTHTFGPITNGNRAWALTTYSGATQIDSYTAISDTAASTNCVSCTHTRQNSDAFGRTILSTLVNDPDGATMTATTYDSSGRTRTVSNPYRSTSDSTYGLTTMSFDNLGRSTVVTEADNSAIKLYYGTDVTTAGGLSAQLCSPATYGYGYPALGVDEAGKKKQTWADAFGRTIEVDEPDPTGTLSLATCYTYDTLDNLTKVEQKGGSTDPTQWRTRTFAIEIAVGVVRIGGGAGLGIGGAGKMRERVIGKRASTPLCGIG